MTVENVDVVVVGAGVGGLHAALAVSEAGRSVVVLEARGRIGGRLLSPPVGSARLDLGATWFWANEPRVNVLAAGAGLPIFDQHIAGAMMFQDDDGVQRIEANQIDAPSSRLASGMQSLPEALAAQLPAGTVVQDSPVDSIVEVGESMRVEAAGASYLAQHVILAVPPATAVARIDFDGQLPERLSGLAAITPVWMGNIVKVVMRYQTAFWRDRGLAGAAFSYVGPLREIHDMSGPDGDPAALFGFAQPGAGAAPTEAEAVEQLVQLFGFEAADPVEVLIKDWRAEQFTSPPDTHLLSSYQAFGHPMFSEPALGGRLHWASTETAATAPGHIEGALSASARAASAVLSSL